MSEHGECWERDSLEVFLILGRELETTATVLQADYASAQLPLGEGELVLFTYDRGTVWVTGHGFEVELSALDGW